MLAAGSTLAFAGVVGGRHWNGVDDRLRQIEDGLAHAPEARRAIEQGLEKELTSVRAELDRVRSELTKARASKVAAAELAGRLAGAETRLIDMAGLIEAHDSSIEVLAEASSEIAPTLEGRMRRQARTMVELWQELRTLVEGAQDLASENAERVRRIADRDVQRMWNELVGPTVQLSGDESVGSGVILRSRLRENAAVSVDAGAPTDGAVSAINTPAEAETKLAPAYDTYVMTAWHVVRDIIVGDHEKPVPVSVYAPDGTITEETATLLAFDAPRDIAILILDTDQPFEFGAELAPPARLARQRIFDSIYAVGCPLGNDPIPTPGEIATRDHLVEGINYWMINAPTYIGNSGGGIFDAESHQLLGIFSKIYTHGTLRPTIVPHMGLVTPLDDVYAWMEDEGFGFLIPAE